MVQKGTITINLLSMSEKQKLQRSDSVADPGNRYGVMVSPDKETQAGPSRAEDLKDLGVELKKNALFLKKRKTKPSHKC